MASVGSVTLGSAGGSYDDGLILVAGCLNRAGLGVVTVGALTGFTSLLGAGGGEGFDPGAHGVTQSIGIAINVSVTTVASMGCVSLFGAGGSGHNRLIAVTQSLDLASFGMIAVLAVVLFLALGGASRFNRHIPFAVAVTQGIDVGVGVGVAAVAGVGGVALVGTGGGRYGGLMLVPKRRYLAGFGVITVGALAGLGSLLSTSGSEGLNPVTHDVTQSVNVRVNVSVTAVAGVSGVTLLGASGGRYNGGIAVASCLNLSGLGMVAVLAILLLGSRFGASRFHCHVPIAVAVTRCIDIGVGVGVTAVAGVGGVTLFDTGRSSHDSGVAVAGCFDLTGFGVVTVGAIMFLGSRFGASGFNHHVPFAVAVTQGIDVGVGVGVAAGGTGMGGVALLGAGGSRYGGLMLVPKCRYLAGFGVVTVGALAGLGSLLSTSGSEGLNPVTHDVTQSVDVRVNVSVTAMAGVSGVTLLGASGGRYNGGIAVTKSRYLTDFGIVTVGALAGLTSLLGAGGGEGFDPGAHGVTQSIGIAIDIGVTAVASVGGVTLLGAGRSRYDGLIVVAKSRYLAGFGVVAVLAILLLGSLFSTGRFHRHVPIAVGVIQSIDERVDVGVTAVANMSGIALLGAGGSRHDGGVAVASCLNLSGLGMVAVLAILLLGSRFGASGFNRHIPVAVAMTQGIDVGVGVGIAADAGVGGVALGGAGGRGYDGFVAMNTSIDQCDILAIVYGQYSIIFIFYGYSYVHC